jgi:alpha-methylacyl-CoA racemase
MGPLQGFRLVEISGIGPGPFCGMLLADMGADIIRICRPGGSEAGVDIPERYNVLNRGRPSIDVDLKSPDGVALVLRLCEKADALFEGFRPGVMEQLGLGPEKCMTVNPGLVYGRVTGWGQDGPLAQSAGHDGNYASIVGAIGAIGERGGPPVVPLNLIGDYGGGGAFYRPYKTKDDNYVFVAAIEPKFYAELLQGTGISELDPAAQFDQSTWPTQVDVFSAAFSKQTRDEWAECFSGTDACVAPILSLSEAPDHPHNQARKSFIEVNGVLQPAPSPRFSRTYSEEPAGISEREETRADTLRAWDVSEPI